MAPACIYVSEASAQSALDDLHARARVMWADAGYVVNESGVVPKVNGDDEPSAQETTRWDELREYPEGWGFISPRAKYPEQADALLSGHTYQEIETETL